MKKLSKMGAALFSIVLLSSSLVYATPTKNNNTKEEIIEVELIYNENASLDLDDIELEDGTKLGDYEYTVKKNL